MFSEFPKDPRVRITARIARKWFDPSGFLAVPKQRAEPRIGYSERPTDYTKASTGWGRINRINPIRRMSGLAGPWARVMG